MTSLSVGKIALTALLLGGTALPALSRDLRVAISADPSQVDPITLSELISGDILKNVYESLSDVDAEGRIIPGLATSWEPHEDGLGFTFKLREGVRFHTGNPFSARDVKATFEQLLIPGNKGGSASQRLARVEGAADILAGTTTELSGVKVIDDLTLEVRFSEPDVLFPLYGINIFDSALIGAPGDNFFASSSGGTGPFEFVEWKRGESVRLAAFADYWDGAPAIDGVLFQVVPEQTTQLSLYDNGDLDVLYLQPETARRVQGDSRYQGQTLEANAAQVNYLGLNADLYEPFRDVRVREAFSIAIDRDGLVNGLFGGTAQPLYGQIAPGVGGYDPDFPVVAHDPDRAKALLAEAGYGAGLPPITIGGLPTNRNETAYLADLYSELFNVEVTVDIQERAAFIRSLNAREVPLFHFGWSAGGAPDAYNFLYDIWHSKSPYNRTGYSNAAYDALLDEAIGVADPEARYALYRQAERLLVHEDWGTSGTYVRNQIALVRPGVEGVVLTPYRFEPFARVTLD